MYKSINETFKLVKSFEASPTVLIVWFLQGQ
ncbi:hypothetical protein GILI108418_04615 [Gillisia limnaea]|uniref:Uncharacterized protein n=1 Tax=Gillisia limnaea (strain DSM 15749 / LMG 21470 / R-8282) TaxID=865937 RepID=H2BUQ5_GILLR|nr:hypothetical protein Gilli_1033 [Gillisia limnaea DSM 15749]